MFVFILALLLMALALLLFWQASCQRRWAGLPAGRVIYADTRAWRSPEKPLYDALLGLTGKPDYLVEEGKQIIPVEVKSGRTPPAPYDSHIFQLAAYCLLVEKTYRRRPPYGVLHYPTRDFAVAYTPELESALLDVLAAMRQQERRGETHRSHEEPQRCARCGFRHLCDERL